MSWTRVGGVLGGAALLIGTAAAVLGVRAPEEPDLDDAEEFLVWYYDMAPQQPEMTWPRLTESFRGRNGQVVTFHEYRRYFHGFERIEVSDVEPSEQSDGWWSARVDFTRYDGVRLRPPSYFQFDLRCPDRSAWPGVECDSDDLEINATDHLDEQYWPDEQHEPQDRSPRPASSRGSRHSPPAVGR